MKSLFFKELKLAMHPIIWVFILIFPFMVLIPSYPIFIGFIYVASCYPILFLGANKGQQSNDVYFTCLLPVKKSDVVKARLMTVLFIQLIFLVIMLALSPVANIIQNTLMEQAASKGETFEAVGISPAGALSAAGFCLIGLAIYDIMFFACFYKNGRSIVMPTLLGMLIFIIFTSVLCILLPYIVPSYKSFVEGELWIQIIIFAGSLCIAVLLNWVAYIVGKNRFEKVDL